MLYQLCGRHRLPEEDWGEHKAPFPSLNCPKTCLEHKQNYIICLWNFMNSCDHGCQITSKSYGQLEMQFNYNSSINYKATSICCRFRVLRWGMLQQSLHKASQIVCCRSCVTLQILCFKIKSLPIFQEYFYVQRHFTETIVHFIERIIAIKG